MKIAVLSCKGGVGKTTQVFNLGHALAERNIRTLMVDCDPQCNLTAQCLPDSEESSTIYHAIKPVYEGVGDIQSAEPRKLKENLYLVSGDVYLSMYEDCLGETWARTSTQVRARLVQTAISRAIDDAKERAQAKVVLIDLGAHLGALPRSAILGCDYFITPLQDTMFCQHGVQIMAQTLRRWHEGWAHVTNTSPEFLGYTTDSNSPELESSVANSLGKAKCLGVVRWCPEIALKSMTERKPMFEYDPSIREVYDNIVDSLPL